MWSNPGSKRICWGLTFNKSYNQLDSAFQIYAIVKTVATLGPALYGQYSTVFVRAKLYLWLRGCKASTSRHEVGVSIATLYRSTRFALGIHANCTRFHHSLGVSGWRTKK
jgi:hypothetical protein